MSDASRLIEVSRELSQARTPDQVQRIVRRAARELTAADGASFVLREDDQCVYVDEDAISPLWKGRRFPMSDCVSGWCMQNHEAAVIPDVFADDRIPKDIYRPTFVRSMVMVPIRRASPVGAIGVYWATLRRPTPHEVEMIQALADGVSVAMERTAGGPPPGAVVMPMAPAMDRCRNLYAFIRLRLGRELSDRELARRWRMNWRSFLNLKEGSRRVPRLEELERLAECLAVDPTLVMLVARGEPADVVNRWLLDGSGAVRRGVMSRLRFHEDATSAPPLYSSIDHLPCAVLTIDLHGRIRDYNARLTGLVADPSQISIGAHFINAVEPESAAVFLRLQTQALEYGEGGPELVHLDGGQPVGVSMVGVANGEGRTVGFQGVLHRLPQTVTAQLAGGSS